jgi:hypothetical protein
MFLGILALNLHRWKLRLLGYIFVLRVQDLRRMVIAITSSAAAIS